MPARATPLVNDHLYHIISRGINSIPIFKSKVDYQFFTQAFCYYQNRKPQVKFSLFKKLSVSQRNDIIASQRHHQDYLVQIIVYCLMPNHFHFILKQVTEKGIINFIRLLNNSYAHYFNLKYQRKGSLFESRFKAVLIETDEQLAHLSRYIHLNPYSGLVIKDMRSLLKYPYSSLSEYLNLGSVEICHKELLRSYFPKVESYKKFVLDRADYQKKLQLIKHQCLEPA